MRGAKSRGISLIDALIALALLSFGLLALTRMQGRMTGQATDALSRSTANQLADELVSRAWVDPTQLGCYTLPASGSCGSAAARAMTNEWRDRVSQSLPAPVSASVTAVGTRLTVTLRWMPRDGDEENELQTVTDVQ
jgi:type IV pilus assembly protein PilV